MTPRRALIGVVLVTRMRGGPRPCLRSRAGAAVAVVGAGVVALLWGATHRHPRSCPIERRDLAVWIVLAAVLAGWQLAAFVQEPRSMHPTISSIADFVLETHVAQALACAGWLIIMGKLAAR